MTEMKNGWFWRKWSDMDNALLMQLASMIRKQGGTPLIESAWQDERKAMMFSKETAGAGTMNASKFDATIRTGDFRQRQRGGAA